MTYSSVSMRCRCDKTRCDAPSDRVCARYRAKDASRRRTTNWHDGQIERDRHARIARRAAPFSAEGLCHEPGACETREQCGRPGIYLNASGFSERARGEPAAKHADGLDVSLPCRGSVIGRITDRDGIPALHAKLLENDLEDVRRRLRFLDVIGGRREVH